MIKLLAILALGFFLGTRHATDPDHVVAVTTIVTRERNLFRSSVVGILWGIGHTLTILVVGGAIIVFGLVIPPRLGLSMEFSVAVMLVLLGVFNLSVFRKTANEIAAGGAEATTFHCGFHSHGTGAANHEHALTRHRPAEPEAPASWVRRIFGRLGLYHTLRPVVVGVVHGLAGSAAIALLILTTIRNPVWGMAYLIVFGLGTVVGMSVITTAIALPTLYGTRSFARANRYFVAASGLLSLAFGLFLVYHIGFINGLFTSHPAWTPR